MMRVVPQVVVDASEFVTAASYASTQRAPEHTAGWSAAMHLFPAEQPAQFEACYGSYTGGSHVVV